MLIQKSLVDIKNEAKQIKQEQNIQLKVALEQKACHI